MVRLCRMLLGASLCGPALHAQIEQLATSGDGRVLVVHSYFRLQTEGELGAQGKIYKWQDGTWTRLAAARSSGFALSPPDVFAPFLSTDASVVGWQVNIGCTLCQIVVGPQFSSETLGVTLPPAFPRGTLRMSPNGRYFTADSYPYPGVQYLDAATGLVADVPVDLFARPVVRELDNDGTALLLITGPADSNQSVAPGVLSLWKPGSTPRPIYSDSRVLDSTISSVGKNVAFEAMAEDGSRMLMVIDTETDERFSISAMLSSTYHARLEGFAKPRWDGSGWQLLYRSYDDQGHPVSLSLWEVASRTSRVLLTSSEGFSDAVISADGKRVWAVTTADRLLALDLGTGEVDEILPPLGADTRSGVSSEVVPGSSVLIRGAAFSRVQYVFDGNTRLPVADVTPEGMWVQIPWEYESFPRSVHELLVRSGNNPFEAVVNVSVTPEPRPQIIRWTDAASGRAYAKAVHADFQSLVTPASPARPGETVHVYFTGLGPLDQSLPTGAPGPLTPLLHPVTPLQCRFPDSPQQVLAMPYVGYAVGLVGFYQADLTIPDGVSAGSQQLLCTVVTSSGTYSSVAPLITTTAQ